MKLGWTWRFLVPADMCAGFHSLSLANASSSDDDASLAAKDSLGV